MSESRILRKVIRIGQSLAITLPTSLAPQSNYVWIMKHRDGLIIKEAKVE